MDVNFLISAFTLLLMCNFEIRMLFWTDWDADDPRIERASMSGEYRTVIKRVSIDGEGKY